MVGLIVLVVIALYFILALSAVITVAVKGKGWKWPITTLLVFILIPTADVIIGKIYFRHLCNTQSGQFIYKTVELGDEYFLKAGEINTYRFGKAPGGYAIAVGGEVNMVKARVDFDMPVGAIKINYSGLFHISKWTYYIKQKNTEELLSESIAFLYKGGWVENIYNVSSGNQCPERGVFNSTSLMQATFYNKK